MRDRRDIGEIRNEEEMGSVNGRWGRRKMRQEGLGRDKMRSVMGRNKTKDWGER